MKTNFKSIISGLICAAMLSSVCFGAALDNFEIVDTAEQRKLIISGTPDGVNRGEGIRVEVLKKNMTSDEIASSYTASTFKDSFILVKQVPADENGGYTVTANMKGYDSGYYVVRVNGIDNRIYFALTEDKEKVIEKIEEILVKGAEETEEEQKVRAVGELKALFNLSNEESTTVLNFNINDKVVFEVNEEELVKRFYLIAEDTTVENFVGKVNLAAYIAGLNENKIDIIDYKTNFELDSEYVNLYEEHVTDENKLTFTEKYFKNKNYETTESVQNAFKPAVLDSWCNYFVNAADVETYINDYGSVVGVNMNGKYDILNTTQKSKLHSYLADKGGFESTALFVQDANIKIDQILNESIGGSTGGLGGGSIGGGGGGTTSGPAGTPGIIPSETVPSAPAEKETFSDMAGFDWAKESVEALYEKGIVSGTGNGKYEPERNVTREEMLVMILRAFEIEIGEGVSDFTDAAIDGWYNAYLAAAKAAGFVSGKPDGSFGVGEAVTREDAAVMAYNIAKAKEKVFNTEKGTAFADDKDVADYASEAVYALKNAEVINGKGEGLFAPKANCTRAEAAKIIYALIK